MTVHPTWSFIAQVWLNSQFNLAFHANSSPKTHFGNGSIKQPLLRRRFTWGSVSSRTECQVLWSHPMDFSWSMSIAQCQINCHARILSHSTKCWTHSSVEKPTNMAEQCGTASSTRTWVEQSENGSVIWYSLIWWTRSPNNPLQLQNSLCNSECNKRTTHDKDETLTVKPAIKKISLGV
jgi:hypothetical protein